VVPMFRLAVSMLKTMLKKIEGETTQRKIKCCAFCATIIFFFVTQMSTILFESQTIFSIGTQNSTIF